MISVTIYDCIILADCTEWRSSEDSYIPGIATDATGANAANWNPFFDLNEAKQECILLNSGCGGVTDSGSGSYSLRLGTSFTPSPSGEISYLKPTDPCEGKY